jgi:hypothetical protein
MTETLLLYLPLITFSVIAALAILKVVIFMQIKSTNTKNVNLLYYPIENIRYTSNAKRKKLKLFQNILSVLIILILVFGVTDTVINHRFD